MSARHIHYESLPDSWKARIRHQKGGNPAHRWTYIASGRQFKNGVACIRHIMHAENLTAPRGFAHLFRPRKSNKVHVKQQPKKISWGRQLEAVMVEVNAAKRQLDEVNSMLVDLRNQVKY